MPEAQNRFSYRTPVNRNVAALKNKAKPLKESHSHVVIERRIIAHDSSVPLQLRNGRQHDVRNAFVHIAVVRPADHILRKIERHSELRTTDDQQLLPHKWTGSGNRRQPVTVIRILMNAEQDRTDLNRHEQQSDSCQERTSCRLTPEKNPHDADENRNERRYYVNDVMRLFRSFNECQNEELCTQNEQAAPDQTLLADRGNERGTDDADQIA